MVMDLPRTGPVPLDREAFEARLRPLLTPAYRLAFAMLGDSAAAEDALQEAALSAWRKLGNLHEGAEMGPWFHGIVANQCRTLRRQRWWSVLRVGHPRATEAGGSDRAADLALRRMVESLPGDQRAVILLHYFTDLPLEQVAAGLGVPLGTVKSRLHRALARLRPMLEQE